jgi:molecular chaperone DnaK
MKLTRAKLEAMIGEIIERTLEPCRKCLKDAGKSAADIHEVVLVGGSIRIPKVQEAVKKFFGKEPHRGVNPDEVVALGAAVQAGVLSGEVKDMLLLDVTPLSLGIETLGGVMTTLIPRNTTIPTRKGEIFSTAADGQTSVEVHVLQGERPMARDNRTLGRFGLDGIPPAPRGVPQVEVTFDIDANGIVNVSAKDKATAKEQKITITASSGLSKDEVDRAVKDAASHEAEDKSRKEQIEKRNQLDTLIYQNEKLLREHGDKISADGKGKMDEALKVAREALKSEDMGRIESAYKALMEVSHRVAEEMYKAAGASAGDAQPGWAGGGEAPGGAAGEGGAAGAGAGEAPGAAKGGNGKKDTVIDAEFEETE